MAGTVSAADRGTREPSREPEECSDDWHGSNHGGFSKRETRGQARRRLPRLSLWIDDREERNLASLKGSESVDIGSRVLGKKFDDKGPGQCPRCKRGNMVNAMDSGKPVFWFEHCPICFGVFFDAGEFREYKERGVLELFQSVMPPSPKKSP